MTTNERQTVFNLAGGAAMRKLLLLAAVLVAAAISLKPAAGSSPVLDQQQPTIDSSVGGLGIGGSSQQRLAQVVTAGRAGALVEVTLPIACDPESDLTVEIQGVRRGAPNGVALASQTFPGVSLPPFWPDPPSFRSFVFASPARFQPGKKLAIVLSAAGECGIFQGPIGDSYSGGNAYFIALPNPPSGWVCICDFPDERLDLPFQTLVDRGGSPRRGRP